MLQSKTKVRRWYHRLLVWCGQILALLLVLLVVEWFLGRSLIGLEAPEFRQQTIEGEIFSLQQLAGRPAVVHFWATWCPVCELEQGMVQQLSRDEPLITVAMQSGGEDEVRSYLAAQGVSYPVVNDASGRIAAEYGVKAVPASFVLDGAGRVRFATRGLTSGWGLRIRLWLASFF